MKTMLAPLLALTATTLLAAGCTGSKKKDDVVPTPTPSNLIDQVLAPRFEAEGIVPVEAGTEELCRRLSADLRGRFVTADEAAQECAGRTVEEIAVDFQGSEEYLVVSERAWRDRFQTTDIFAGWRDLKSLYTLVDAMHKDEIPYDTFAVEAMSHPGIMMLLKLPEERAERIYTAFLGRTPSISEMNSMAALYRPWTKATEDDLEIPPVGGAYLAKQYAIVDPSLCNPVSVCATDLYGGAALDFSSFPPAAGPIRYTDLNATQLDALRAPGHLLVAQDFFWEAAADEILNRLLAWSDGGNFPNEPGILLPEVREVLADFLRATRSIAQGERLVMGSWLYRMTSRVPDDGFGDDPTAPVLPYWATGTRAPVTAEVWLDSVKALTQDYGACDPRYSDHYQYLFMDAPGAEQAAARLALWTLQENRTPWDGVNQRPDLTYRAAARKIGGCPGFITSQGAGPRMPQTGLAHAFAQESLAEQLCVVSLAQHLAPAGAIDVASVVQHQSRLALGRDAAPEEIAGYQAAFASCAGPECSPDGILNGICVGILGSAEMIFH